jgi:macrolide transport system ATP-binding/permease protein/lipoprotein-releasing system ATP-binding protein
VNAFVDRTSLLESLSDADKDALITRLWRDLQAERVRSGELERRLSAGTGDPARDDREASALLKRLRQTAAGQRGPRQLSASLRLGSRRSFSFIRSRRLMAAAGIIALAFALDFAIGRYQQYRLEQKRLADLRLQHAAYEGMFVEVVNVAYEPDQKSYRLRMKFTNSAPGRPLYVMQSPVRVFEQSGLSWREVPSRDSHGEPVHVINLANSYTFETVFEPNLKEWTELIPGYMHIRFESDSLISERSDPDDDIIDRKDRYYVYLKPHRADDDAIRKRMKIQGDPPVYMPMPPH